MYDTTHPQGVEKDRQLRLERSYWLRKLAGEVPDSNLPIHWSRGHRNGGSMGHASVDLGGDLYAGLVKLTRGGDFLLYVTLMAALKVCLYRYSGAAAVAVGSPSRRRDPGESANQVVILDPIDEDTPFKDFLLQVRQTLLDAYARQHYPFARLLEDLGHDPATDDPQLFSVGFGLEQIHGKDAELRGDVRILAKDTGDRLTFRLHYNEDLFAPESIERFMAHFDQVLRSSLENMASPLREIGILSPGEERRLAEWNDTSRPFSERPLPERVARHAGEAPDAPALVGPGGESVTYAELDRRAGQLAGFLRSRGLADENLVALFVEPSVDFVVGALAVLKAGGAYLPLDVSHPRERLAFVLDDASPRFILSRQGALERLPETGVETVLLDDPETPWRDSAAPAVAIDPRQRAYVIYTSGSTGRPKGVEVSHRGLCQLCAWHVRLYGLTAADRGTQLAGVAFDASVWEVWPYLGAGASVHLPPPEVRSSPADLARWIARREITVSFLPTPLAEAALAESWPRNVRLRYLLTGGDRLNRAPRKALPFTLVNNYGPTENTVVATAGEVAPERRTDAPPPSIGRPIDNVRVHLVDRALRRVPVGVAGEIFLAGDSLARGYLDRPRLTAERFVPDPFAAAPGERLYRTGDLARFRCGGEIEFLGRTDHQVQLRGHRLELGEVEAILRRHPGVREAVAMLRDDGPSGPALVAYCIPGVCDRGSSPPEAGDLRAFLAERLPEHGVPACVVQLAKWPLTANGKIDREALPAPQELSGEASETAGKAPRTPVEEILLGVFSEILGKEVPGIDSNFFELGAHSLLATRVMSRIRDIFLLELPLRTLFEAPTVDALAPEVERARLGRGRGEIAALVPLPREDGRDLPVSYAQQRLWFLDQLDGGRSPFYNIPAAVHLTAPVDPAALACALDDIVRRHQALRTVFPGNEGTPRAVALPPARRTWPVVDLRGLGEDPRRAEARRLAEEEIRRPFDLAAGPLLRALLVTLADDDHVLVVNTHHIVSDGWSLEIFMDELAELYSAISRGETPTLQDPPLQYADFADWQRRWLADEALAAQLEYWRRQLDGAPALLELPADRPRPAVQSFRGANRFFSLAGDTTETLKGLARDRGVTLFMTLTAAFKTLLHRYTGQRDVVVGSPVANRGRLELEPMIGLFVNNLVLRTDLGVDPTFDALLERVRDVALGAYAHQDVPFEMLVDELDVERHLSHSPLFQVVLVLQHAPPERTAGDGFSWKLLEVDSGTSKFDLTLYVWEESSGLRGALEFNTDLFEPATAEKLLDHFQRLLAGIADDPSQPLSELPLAGEAERRELLAAALPRRAALPAERPVHELFAAVAAEHPDRPAVMDGRRDLTYRDLDRLSNGLARRLAEAGVGPETRVPLYAERSSEALVGLLGILKAGGAYVPIHPLDPVERAAALIAGTGSRVLVTQAELARELPELAVRTLLLEDVEERAEAPAIDVRPEHLAYVIHTSGSTGEPRAVGVEHRSAAHLAAALGEAVYDGRRTLRIALNGPLSFDTSVKQVLQLLAGHTLRTVPEEVRLDGRAFAEFVRREALDVVDCTPSQLARMSAGAFAGDGRPRTLLLGGEAVPEEAWRRLAEDPGIRAWNLYGPTECTVDATAARVRGAAVTLGAPLAGVRVHVLDERGRAVPFGIAGEIAIGGPGVSRGYLGDPRATAARFVPDPFAEAPGERFYRTGDVARRTRDGRLEYLGRRDDQVKIRGYRIEPREVEETLRRHPDVEAAFVGLDDRRTGGRLTAYVAPCRRRAPQVGGRARAVLPNGLAPVQLNDNETDFLYRDIFERRAYLRHGLELRPGDCVIDVGANLGMFSLFAGAHAPGGRFYAFEPNPHVYELLTENASLYGLDARLFNCAVGAEGGRAEFTFYPRSSFLSGLHAQSEEDKELVRSYLRRRGESAASEELLEELLDRNFEGRRLEVEVRTLSDVLADEGIERVDFLKINVEKAEKEVLDGLRDEDWPKIRQVVLEVHDRAGRLAATEELLTRHGLAVTVERDWSLDEQTSIYYVYATRGPRQDGAGLDSAPAETFEPPITAAELAAFLRGRLPEVMVPGAVVVLEEIPLTAHGKIDRAALPAPAETARENAGRAALATATEEMVAAIWSQVLGIEEIGAEDGFFELGGHSLLATQVVARVRELFRVELPLRTLFQKPTVAALAAAVDALRDGEGTREAFAALRPAPRAGRLPLSFSQQRLWFLDRLESGRSPFYNIPAAFQLRGPLDAGILEASLGEIVRRHESLRTTFRAAADQAHQVVVPAGAFALPVIDLGALEPEDRRAAAGSLARQEARRPFDLERGPLFRINLLRLAGSEHVLLLNLHHIISDGWSLGVVLGEVAALYEAFAAGRPSPLPPLALQYADFAHWQRQTWPERQDRELGYWKEQLAGAPRVLELPADRPRPAVQTVAGAIHHRALPAALTADLEAFGRHRGATLFMILLAAFKAVLHRYSGQDDVVVGSPIANRRHVELEGMVGFFVNTLVMRTDLGGRPDFRRLVERVRGMTLDAYAHQDVPFETLVDALDLPRDLSYTPFFQVMFVLQNAPLPPVRIPGVESSILPVDSGTAKFDLTLFTWKDGDRLVAALEHNTDLFDRVTMERFWNHFERFLARAVEDPGRPIDAVHLLDAAERHQLLTEGNDTGVEHTPRPIHRWVEEQVDRTPEATAVVFGDRRLSYRELDERANRLAHLLRRHGVGPEVLVGICVDRCLEMVVGLYAVLKAGGGAVALDTTYPRDRLAYVIADAGMPVLLTQSSLHGLLPETAAHVLDLDRVDLAGESAARPADTGADADALDRPMYAIYTSGSTGTPKGVIITHRAFDNLLDWHLRHSPLAGRACTVQFATFGFCVSFQEIFTAWASGSTLVLLDEWLRKDFPSLVRFLDEHGVERLHLPFAGLKMLAEVADQARGLPRRLRDVVTAGEQLQVSAPVRRLLERLGGCRLHNQYGASETHVVTSHALSGDPGEWPVRPPIGRPVTDVAIHVLDDRLEPVPAGVPGEVCAGGASPPRGYIHDPARTAEKVVPDPFGREPGGRLYRTGDLARTRHDGTLEHLGRIDGQVKIRGHRLEPGEIETVLRGHADVADAAVVPDMDAPGGGRLVAYVVPETGRQVETRTLRADLKGRLPEFMVPSAVVVLDRLPVNANGKLDRQALPAPEPARPELEAVYVAPRSDLEERVAAVWRDVLGIERAGVHDNFFELGGDSINSIRIVLGLGQQGLEVEVRDLFQYQTVAELAAVLAARRREPPAASARGGMPEVRVDEAELDAFFDSIAETEAAR